jgi:4-(gamma-glutamylamino)butanal dehydrogenase
LLTKQEYHALAAGLDFPTSAFIDSAYRPAASGKTFASVNPATGKTLAEIAACDATDVDFAVTKAREAFEDGRWPRMLRVGTVTVTSFGEGDITTPFGGYKQSGFGGRDNSLHAHDEYTQLKTIWIDLSDDGDEAVD